MKEAGLNSDILKPSETFLEGNEKADLMLPSTSIPFLDPKPEDFHSKLVESLGLNEEHDHVNPEIMEKFEDLLKQYPNVFVVPGSPLGEIKGFEHSTETGDAAPIYKSPYRKSPKELKANRDEIERILTLKIIQLSKSEWGSPVILVRKPPEKGKPQPPRFVVDYLSLNQITKGDAYPVPAVSNVLDATSSGKVFSKFHLASGYWQVQLREKDRHRSAFTTYTHL